MPTSFLPEHGVTPHFDEYHEQSIDVHLRRGLTPKEIARGASRIEVFDFPMALNAAAQFLEKLSDAAAVPACRMRLILKHGLAILKADERIKESGELLWAFKSLSPLQAVKGQRIIGGATGLTRLGMLGMQKAMIPATSGESQDLDTLRDKTGWTDSMICKFGIVLSLNSSELMPDEFKFVLQEEADVIHEWIDQNLESIREDYAEVYAGADETQRRALQHAQSEGDVT